MSHPKPALKTFTLDLTPDQKSHIKAKTGQEKEKLNLLVISRPGGDNRLVGSSIWLEMD